MSIPKGTTSWYGRYEDPEKFRLIPQAGLRVRIDPAKTDYTSCWDLCYSPSDGLMYYAPCNEQGIGSQALLVAYDYAKDKAWIAMRTEDYTLPRDRVMPHSKIHESMNIIPNPEDPDSYLLVGATHSTDRAPHQPEWMPFSHTDHVWEGFPGSYILLYDPKTGKTRNLGMPVPRESIYGACYDPKYNALYMIGFMRGHVYRYSFEDQSVKDLGKAAEVFCYRLHRGPDGNIYGSTKSGFLWRVNVDTQKLEDMHFRMPPEKYNYSLNTWYRYMCQGVNVPSADGSPCHEFVYTADAGENLFIVDTNTCEVRKLGHRMPVDFENDFETTNFMMNELGCDRYGVLWYVVVPEKYGFPTEDLHKTPAPTLLVSWDFRHEEKPRVHGIVSTDEHWLRHNSCLTVDPVNDRLYIVGDIRDAKNFENDTLGVGLFIIDLTEFRKHMNEPGPIVDLTKYVREMTEEEKAEAIKKANGPAAWAGEEVSEKNPVVPFTIDKVTPIRLWRETETPEESAVRKLAWDEEGNLHGMCEGEKQWYFKIKPRPEVSFASREEAEETPDFWIWRSILRSRMETREENGRFIVKVPQSFSFALDTLMPYDDLYVRQDRWMDKNGYPKPVEADPALKLPEVAGRRYLAKASCTLTLPDGRVLIGTQDGLLAIVKDGKVFNLGNCAPQGPVRCMCITPDGKTVYGTAGDDEDMGWIFTYDDHNGLLQKGCISYNSHGWMDGPTAAHLLTCAAVSPDGKYLAIGNADRLGCVHIFKLN